MQQPINNRGLAKNALGQYEAAIDDCDEAIRLNPENAYAYKNRGLVKHFLGQHGEAIADYKEAIRIQPNLAENLYSRGKDKASFGHIQSARLDFEPALELAKQTGNESLKTKIEQALQELDNAN